MAVSEQTIQEAFADALRDLKEFEDADVTINDWSRLDDSMDDAPYVIIENSDDFDSRRETTTATDDFNIPMVLAVKLGADTWKEAMDGFRDARQAILDMVNSDNGRSAFGQVGVYVDRVRPDGPIGYIYPPDVDQEQLAYATPLFVSQRIIAQIKEF
jgi:hypothetical protein